MIYLKIFLFALFLYAFLKFARNLIPRVPAGKQLRSAMIRLFPVIEMLFWFLFIINGAQLLFGELPTYPVIMTAIILSLAVILAWYFLRDFVAGSLLRGENGFEPGMEIKTDVAEGTIHKVGYRSLELLTPKGETVKVPYSLISNTTITRKGGKTKKAEHLLELTFGSGLEISRVKSLIGRRIMEMPWITSEESMNVEISALPGGKYNAKVRFFTITAETAAKTEENLRKFVEGLEG